MEIKQIFLIKKQPFHKKTTLSLKNTFFTKKQIFVKLKQKIFTQSQIYLKWAEYTLGSSDLVSLNCYSVKDKVGTKPAMTKVFVRDPPNIIKGDQRRN